jgi:hypothetical protein
LFRDFNTIFSEAELGWRYHAGRLGIISLNIYFQCRLTCCYGCAYLLLTLKKKVMEILISWETLLSGCYKISKYNIECTVKWKKIYIYVNTNQGSLLCFEHLGYNLKTISHSKNAHFLQKISLKVKKLYKLYFIYYV